jgi:hypothetical protein
MIAALDGVTQMTAKMQRREPVRTTIAYGLGGSVSLPEQEHLLIEDYPADKSLFFQLVRPCGGVPGVFEGIHA